MDNKRIAELTKQIEALKAELDQLCKQYLDLQTENAQLREALKDAAEIAKNEEGETSSVYELIKKLAEK